MKATLLEIEAVLSNATAELSVPKPNVEKAKLGIEVAREKLLDLAEKPWLVKEIGNQATTLCRQTPSPHFFASVLLHRPSFHRLGWQ